MRLYDSLIEKLTTEAQQEQDIIGLLLTGSLARGDALPGTDIDLRYVLADGLSRPFERQTHDGILVERGYSDTAAARAGLDMKPMNVYAYLDGRILYDPEGALVRLRQDAQHRFSTYEMAADDRATIAFLLGCSRDKITVALGGGDLLKAAFVTGTSSWQIIEGLWAANGKPVPPNSSVRPHLRDLSRGPYDVENLYSRLFVAETQVRVQVALDLIDWIIDQLS